MTHVLASCRATSPATPAAATTGPRLPACSLPSVIRPVKLSAARTGVAARPRCPHRRRYAHQTTHSHTVNKEHSRKSTERDDLPTNPNPTQARAQRPHTAQLTQPSDKLGHSLVLVVIRSKVGVGAVGKPRREARLSAHQDGAWSTHNIPVSSLAMHLSPHPSSVRHSHRERRVDAVRWRQRNRTVRLTKASTICSSALISRFSASG